MFYTTQIDCFNTRVGDCMCDCRVHLSVNHQWRGAGRERKLWKTQSFMCTKIQIIPSVFIRRKSTLAFRKYWECTPSPAHLHRRGSGAHFLIFGMAGVKQWNNPYQCRWCRTTHTSLQSRGCPSQPSQTANTSDRFPSWGSPPANIHTISSRHTLALSFAVWHRFWIIKHYGAITALLLGIISYDRIKIPFWGYEKCTSLTHSAGQKSSVCLHDAWTNLNTTPTEIERALQFATGINRTLQHGSVTPEQSNCAPRVRTTNWDKPRHFAT